MFSTNQDKYGYYILFSYNDIIEIEDSKIAKQLSISLQEYINILIKFDAFERPTPFSLYYFTHKQDCKECCAYLEDKYSVIIKLINN